MKLDEVKKVGAIVSLIKVHRMIRAVSPKLHLLYLQKEGNYTDLTGQL
jgi:hypothetical protein